jgi:type 1 fimbria pilin
MFKMRKLKFIMLTIGLILTASIVYAAAVDLIIMDGTVHISGVRLEAVDALPVAGCTVKMTRDTVDGRKYSVEVLLVGSAEPSFTFDLKNTGTINVKDIKIKVTYEVDTVSGIDAKDVIEIIGKIDGDIDVLAVGNSVQVTIEIIILDLDALGDFNFTLTIEGEQDIS